MKVGQCVVKARSKCACGLTCWTLMVTCKMSFVTQMEHASLTDMQHSVAQQRQSPVLLMVLMTTRVKLKSPPEHWMTCHPIAAQEKVSSSPCCTGSGPFCIWKCVQSSSISWCSSARRTCPAVPCLLRGHRDSCGCSHCCCLGLTRRLPGHSWPSGRQGALDPMLEPSPSSA